MRPRRAFIRGLFAGVLVMVAVDSLRWLLTPGPRSGAFGPHHYLVLARGVLALFGAIWLTRGVSDEPRRSPPRATPGGT